MRRTSKETVQLHQQLEVDIVTLGRLAVAGANVMAIEVDTCARSEVSIIGLLIVSCPGRRLVDGAITASKALRVFRKGL